MKDLLEKITSYNLFNYLLPGAVFVGLAKWFLDVDLVQENDLIGAFLYYFIGMVISRVGSLVIEPFLKYLNFIKMAEYSEFISASKIDAKIEVLSETNNTYRTIASMLFVLIFLKLYFFIKSYFFVPDWVNPILLAIMLLVIFFYSYKKQTSYIKKRIAAAVKNQT